MYPRQQGQGIYIPLPGFSPGYPGYPSGGSTDRRLERLERQVERLDRQVDRLNRRLERIERRLGIGEGGYGQY